MSEKANLGPIQPGLNSGVMAAGNLLLATTAELTPSDGSPQAHDRYNDYGNTMLRPQNLVGQPVGSMDHGPRSAHALRGTSTPTNRNRLSPPIISWHLI